MAKQLVGLGSEANDGTGDNLRVGMDKVNDNFVEIYTALGTGTSVPPIAGTLAVLSICPPTASGALSDAQAHAAQGVQVQLAGNQFYV